uniref:nucleolus and neural progenitor protein isoform X1 n=2 Tax=Myxine glutinosa TaxID=7769 RepID=UPI00358F19A6
MVTEPWNMAVFDPPADLCIVKKDRNLQAALGALCEPSERVLLVLTCPGLCSDVTILRRILFSRRLSLSHHHPYRAAEQVVRDLRRLSAMHLDHWLRRLNISCQSITESDDGCSLKVPDKQWLEWLLFRTMGASWLLVHTLEMISRAFLLTVQHLCVDEYVQFNVILTSTLSRLRIFLRVLFHRLSALYEAAHHARACLLTCQHSIPSNSKTFPLNLKVWLGPKADTILSDKPKEEATASTLDRLLDQPKPTFLIPEEEEIAGLVEPLQKIKCAEHPSRENSDEPTPSSPEDVMQPMKVLERMGTHKVMKRPARSDELLRELNGHDVYGSPMLHLNGVRAAASFGALLEQLSAVVAERRRWKIDAVTMRCLRAKMLKCRHFIHLENLGYKLLKKLNLFRGSICKLLSHIPQEVTEKRCDLPHQITLHPLTNDPSDVQGHSVKAPVVATVKKLSVKPTTHLPTFSNIHSPVPWTSLPSLDIDDIFAAIE